MKTVTFFSYKGGNGRTLTAANFAVYLTKLGLKVVIMDFDLDAPGVDSKFPDFTLPQGQLGLIDYVLQFQREGSPPGPIERIYCKIPLKSPKQECELGLIPAGDYIATDYPGKLNELNWSIIFSSKRDGVAFFQLFLEQIEKDLAPDMLIIDSRTGFSEIGGLCTQQLADETVILTSLARESVKMTRHLAQVIRGSEISKQLKKTVETKIVVCRVPKPRDVDKLKARCCKMFDVDERRLFFLFSCPSLEQDEFVAMMDTQKEESLVSSYVQLFQGLNVEVAQRSIREEIERTESGLLSCTAEEADARIREMVALYPHAEVYRRAMRFFNLRRRPEDASSLGLRLLDLLPEDAEANLQVARFLLEGRVYIVGDRNVHFTHPSLGPRPARGALEMLDVYRVVAIIEHAFGELKMTEKIRMADLLEDLGKYERSHQIVKECLGSGHIEDPETRLQAIGIAARTALKLGKRGEAVELVSEIPISQLRGGLAAIAIQQKQESGDTKGAFELAKLILARELDSDIINLAFDLSKQLGQRKEFEEIIRTHPGLRKGHVDDPEVFAMLERCGFDMSEYWQRSFGARRARRLNS